MRQCTAPGEAMTVRDSLRFFLTQKLPFDAARVNLDPEVLLDQARQSFGPHRGLGNPCSRQEFHHRRRQFVTAAWSGLLGNQTGEPTVLEGRLGLVERWPGQAECLGRLG